MILKDVCPFFCKKNIEFLWYTHFWREILSWEFTHFFRRLFWTEKQNPQKFLLFGCMVVACLKDKRPKSAPFFVVNLYQFHVLKPVCIKYIFITLLFAFTWISKVRFWHCCSGKRSKSFELLQSCNKAKSRKPNEVEIVKSPKQNTTKDKISKPNLMIEKILNSSHRRVGQFWWMIAVGELERDT